MIKKYLFLVLIIVSGNIFAQMQNDSINKKYLEDQIYLTLTYNILNNKPQNLSQNGFSGSFAIGFIKDLPMNSNRNIGFGLGIGYSYGVFIQNMKILENSNVVEIATDYSINRFRMHSVEVPIEFRWRTSTPSKYKFWRVYGGVKLAYNFAMSSKFKDDFETVDTKNIQEFNQFQSGLFVSAGYSTWNLYIYYGLTPLFDELQLNNKMLNLKEISIGLKFYIM
jgi:hypothetical protein